MMLWCLIFQATLVASQHYSDSPTSIVLSPPPMTYDPIPENCYNFTIGNWRLQEFFSPNYPGEYINNADCVLYLEAPSGFTVKLDFRHRFILEKSAECKYDFLEVRDGPFAYSPLIGRYCDATFPPLIKSSGRYLWLRFKTDDILQYNGFKAVYSYLKEQTQNDGTHLANTGSAVCRIPVKLSANEPDGILNTDMIPFGDLNNPKYPKNKAVDCTWEIFTDTDKNIKLRSGEMTMSLSKNCDFNNVTIFENTTVENDIIKTFCEGSVDNIDMTTQGNRVFLRVFANSLKHKPALNLVYSMVRRSVSNACLDHEFACDGICMVRSVRCNGIINCKDRSDEKGCRRIPTLTGQTRRPVEGGGNQGLDSGVTGGAGSEETNTAEGIGEKSTDGSTSSIPMHIIILGAVGGVILTCGSITICVACIVRRKDGGKRKEATRQHSSGQRNALEMAVNSSSNTNSSLLKQSGNESSMNRGGPGGDRHHYYQRANSQSSPGGRDNPHRYSLGGGPGLPGSMNDSEAPYDQMTESGNYKRFLAMDLNPEETTVLDESLQGSMYPPSPSAIMGMTSLEPTSHHHGHHRMPEVYAGYPSNQWHHGMGEDTMIYPYGSSSLNRPTPFLGLSKQFSYNGSDSKYLKAMKTAENDTIKEHVAS